MGCEFTTNNFTTLPDTQEEECMVNCERVISSILNVLASLQYVWDNLSTDRSECIFLNSQCKGVLIVNSANSAKYFEISWYDTNNGLVAWVTSLKLRLFWWTRYFIVSLHFLPRKLSICRKVIWFHVLQRIVFSEIEDTWYVFFGTFLLIQNIYICLKEETLVEV